MGILKVVKSSTGIVSYGSYLPKYRITLEEIAKTYNKESKVMLNGLGIVEKTVPGIDEDTITNAVNASRQALSRLKIYTKKFQPMKDVGAIYVGSESHPYAVKPSAVIVGEALGVSTNYTAADTEFACKAGTAGMQMIAGLIDSGRINLGIAIGSDTAQGSPGDALEYSAASGAASFILGDTDLIARLIHMTSFTTDTPDFWRRECQKYPMHWGRFTGEPAYFRHTIGVIKNILEETNTKLENFDHVIFHMPNGKFPKLASKILKISDKQMKFGFIVQSVGNTYSACSLLGLVNVLDNAKPNEKILLTSYGSGAGSDAFIFEVTKNIIKYNKAIQKLDFDKTLEEQIGNKSYLTYGQYVRYTKKLT